MKRKTCSEYKDTGIRWLGEIPKHWEVKKIKYTSVLLNGYAFDSNSYVDTGVSIIRIGDVGSEIDWNEIKRVPSDLLHILSRFRVLKGDILIALTGATIGKNSVFKTDKVALLNQRVGIIRGLHIEQSFVKYVVCSDGFKKAIDFLCYGGAQDNIGKEDVGNISTGLPPLSEQRAIAAFLDRETQRIDTLIAKKQRQIELLQEKRAALISYVVTKGLNPKAKMKDSGVEWLGEIPEHWEAKALRHLIIGGTRNGLYKNREHYQDDGIPMIQMGEAFESPVIEKCAYDRVRLMPSELILWQLVEGDLLFARRSLVFEGSGKCSIVGKLSEPHVFESSLIRVRPNKSLIISFFLYWFLQSQFSRSEILAMTKKVTISGIDSQQIKGMTVVVPPLHEQEEIVKLIGRKNSEIDSLMGKLLESIERLKEYCNTLISAAVTGKINVREEVT